MGRGPTFSASALSKFSMHRVRSTGIAGYDALTLNRLNVRETAFPSGGFVCACGPSLS